MSRCAYLISLWVLAFGCMTLSFFVVVYQELCQLSWRVRFSTIRRNIDNLKVSPSYSGKHVINPHLFSEHTEDVH